MKDLKDFKPLKEIKELVKERKEAKRYYRPLKVNQFKLMNGFLDRLEKKFGDELLVEDKHLNILNMELDGGTVVKAICPSEDWCFANFYINGNFYYIQFGDNPLFDEDSFLGVNGHYIIGNVNNLFEGTELTRYTNACNIEKSIENLFDWFMKYRYVKSWFKGFSFYLIPPCCSDETFAKNKCKITLDI